MMDDKTPRVFSWFDSRSELSTFESLGFACVYAIGPKSGNKIRIGWARSPMTRIQALQEGCWQELIVHDLVWLAGDLLARRLNEEVQRFLTKSGREIRPNWYDLPKEMMPACFSVACNNLAIPSWTHESMLDRVKRIHESRISTKVNVLSKSRSSD